MCSTSNDQPLNSAQQEHSSFSSPRPVSNDKWIIFASLAVLLLAVLPYLIVAQTTPPDLQFGAMLVNPIDGQSYLAKIRQGYDGSWLFRLPYTAIDDADAFLFTFFLGLGHVARLAGLPLTSVYHLARIVGGFALLLGVYKLIARVFDLTSVRRWTWMFVALSAGLGWLGLEATDVTIPESNTFFSILTNAHFAAATALIIVIYLAILDVAWLHAALASLLLAILQPFAPIAVFAALGVFLFLRWLKQRSFPRTQTIVVVLAGLAITPLMLYFYFVTQRDPILQRWTAQNVTLSPPLLDYLFGYGLMWILAIPGGRWALRRGRDVDLMLVAWVTSSAILLYAPLPLQRRFSLGLHIPLVLLAMLGLWHVVLPRLHGHIRKWLPRLVLAVSLPTTLLLLLATSSAALRPPDGRLFFSNDEALAFDWLRQNAARDAVVLTAPETGLFVPAWADTRVVYGHPFETIDAEATRETVEQFLAGTVNQDEVIDAYGVDFVFFGPREKELGSPAADWRVVYSTGDVTIYRVP